MKLKHSANRPIIEGKRVILVDDSIVRGTTSTKIVRMLRDAGAKEVHMRISSPMIFYPDFYGIDTPRIEDLLANKYPDLKSMCNFIGADSLEFLSTDGLYLAIIGEKRNNSSPQFTDHYFTGHYPTHLTDQKSIPKVHKLSVLKTRN
ncbi:amidophosphoribosyltransferase [Bartonella schoenbuchensis R1]|uniref:Amidophosphoribosyltransferase n=1 Tax=Bartonella schoenbuchensis (strain DSM 13525 / NCTC 13165 / R1) TaxID=687861 RepID=A0A1S6XPK5_BARSR|nr:amidophosphoribosyltransferase [Bartonella schoenbuchensis R1]